jgi:hypothetical protein
MAQTVPKQEREPPQQRSKTKRRLNDFRYGWLAEVCPGGKAGVCVVGWATRFGQVYRFGKVAVGRSAFPDLGGFGNLRGLSPLASHPGVGGIALLQGSIAQLILDALHRHELAVSNEQLEAVLAKVILLFDGVNELPSNEARTELIAFRHNHPKLPMIFTTRDLSLGGDLGIERKLEMLPLTEPQMQAFIRAYIPEQSEVMLRQLRIGCGNLDKHRFCYGCYVKSLSNRPYSSYPIIWVAYFKFLPAPMKTAVCGSTKLQPEGRR